LLEIRTAVFIVEVADVEKTERTNCTAGFIVDVKKIELYTDQYSPSR
jgi:hypothetical protein